LEDAIRSGTLTPYAYYPHAVKLTPDEAQTWAEVTETFRRLYARSQAAGGDGAEPLSNRLKLLLIQRARIIKSAQRKVSLAAEVLAKHYKPGQRWIVYCDDSGQLAEVKEAIRAAGVPDVYEYHSGMPGDRARTLQVFSERGGVVVSIRCLDEGVDIPAVSHALILASSKNPREFIQRRGRVLRRYPGKALAHVHDVVVAPEAEDADELGGSILKGELARAIEFGTHAINPAAVTDLKRLAAQAGIDWSDLSNGFETDADEASSKELTDA
jgi:superfamily II DNA or RNA helicase